MADEKTSEIDDWLKDLDEPDENPSSASEKEIESLLAEEAADDVASSDQSDIDSLFGDTPSEKKESAESPAKTTSGDKVDEGGLLDQSDIDSLLGGDAKSEQKQSAVAAEKAEAEDGLLDQSDIDSLFGSDSKPDPQKSDEEESEDEAGLLDQSDIDSLFANSGGGDKATAVPEKSSGSDDFSELDQSDIDELFGDSKIDTLSASESEAPSQDEMDQLFAERGKSEKEVKAGAEDSFSTPGGNAFDFFGEDADFGESDDGIPDIPEDSINHEEERTLAGDVFSSVAASKELTAALAADTKADSDQTRLSRKPFAMPAFLTGGMKWIFLGVVLSLAAIAAGVYFAPPWKKTAPPAIELTENGTAGKEQALSTPEFSPASSTTAANSAPSVGDVALLMGESPGALSVSLSGEDPDGDALQFVVTDPPQFGRLSGDPPELTYLPSNNFPGCDQFVYRASDGKDVSASATVVITGPDLRQIQVAAPAEIKTISPDQPLIAAKDITLRTESTRELQINWKSIWQASNTIPFGKSVSVEVFGKPKFGTLKKRSSSQHVYRPEPYQSGTITLAYRFRRGGVDSKKRALRLIVEVGDPRPEIKLRPLADSYNVGDTVVIDASATRDDHPATLMFSWEQVDGVPVRIQPLNQAASAVSFVAPAAFYTAHYPEPVIKLTAIDQTGQSDTIEIRVKAKSRRRSALWNGEKGRNVSDQSADSGFRDSALWATPR